MRKFEPLTLPGEKEIAAIHRVTLDVLDVTGVRFESERVL